jgi:preprotein translocase subunit SecG
MGAFAMTVLMLVGFLMMFIILLQRGRGGGLAGAFGGAGGQSALGTRAGDVFTKITIVLAVIWVLIAAGSGPLLRSISSEYTDPTSDRPEVSKSKKDTEKDDSTIPPPVGDTKGSSKKDDAGSKKGSESSVPEAEGFNPFEPKDSKKPDAEKPAQKPETEKPAEKKESPEKDAPEAKKPETKPDTKDE